MQSELGPPRRQDQPQRASPPPTTSTTSPRPPTRKTGRSQRRLHRRLESPAGDRREHRLGHQPGHGRAAARRPRARHHLPLPGGGQKLHGTTWRRQELTTYARRPAPIPARQARPQQAHAPALARLPRLGDGLPGRQERRPGRRARGDRRRRRPAGRRRRRAVTYGSTASFAGGGQGAPPASQYIATRGAARLVDREHHRRRSSRAPTTRATGVPYQLFSADLGRGLLLNGDHCRGEGTRLRGRQPAAGGHRRPGGLPELLPARAAGRGFAALLGAADVGALDLEPGRLRPAPRRRLARPAPRGPLHLRGAHRRRDRSPARRRLRPGQAEPLRVDARAAALSLVNTGAPAPPSPPRPARSPTTAPASTGPTRGGDLYLHEGAADQAGRQRRRPSRPPPPTARSPSTRSHGHLYATDAGTHSSTDLTPSGGVAGRARRLRRRRPTSTTRPPPASSSGTAARRPDRAGAADAERLPADHRHRPGQRRRHPARSSSRPALR